MEYLEKIDLIRERLHVSFEEANKALQETEEDVVQALIYLEQKLEKEEINTESIYRVKGKQLLDKIKKLINEGNVKKIAVKSEEKTLLEIPVNAGLVSLVLFPYITVIAGLAAMYKEYTLEIEKEEEK